MVVVAFPESAAEVRTSILGSNGLRNNDSSNRNDDDDNSCSSSSSGSSGFDSSFLNDRDDEDKNGPNNEIQSLAHAETSKIRRWRWIVLILILFTGVIVTTSSFLFLRNLEKEENAQSVSAPL